MIEITVDGYIIEFFFQRDRTRENRIVYPNTDHRIALRNLTFNSNPVLGTTGGEFVSYVAKLPDGTVYDSGNASYGLIDNLKNDVWGWYFYLHAPSFKTTITITWSVGIQAARQTWMEKIDVVDGPLINRSAAINADGYVV